MQEGLSLYHLLQNEFDSYRNSLPPQIHRPIEVIDYYHFGRRNLCCTLTYNTGENTEPSPDYILPRQIIEPPKNFVPPVCTVQVYTDEPPGVEVRSLYGVHNEYCVGRDGNVYIFGNIYQVDSIGQHTLQVIVSGGSVGFEKFTFHSRLTRKQKLSFHRLAYTPTGRDNLPIQVNTSDIKLVRRTLRQIQSAEYLPVLT